MTSAPAASGAKPPLHLVVAAPRGFCAGGDRAIRIVAPGPVRHQVLRNRHVVDRLRGTDMAELEQTSPDSASTRRSTAAASAPEVPVRELADRLGGRFTVRGREVSIARARVAFEPPRSLDVAA